MSKRAEEAALKAYPPIIIQEKLYPDSTVVDYNPKKSDLNVIYRIKFQEGYEQAEKEWEQMKNEHAKELLYVCQKTAEREHRSGVREGRAQAEKELISLINRLCEAILFEWKDAADLARKTLTQIKAWEEE